MHRLFLVPSLSDSSLAALAGGAHAQSAPDSNSASGSAMLPESVIVTATRIATPAEQIASSATVVTAADIAVTGSTDPSPGAGKCPRAECGADRRAGSGQTNVFMRTWHLIPITSRC